MGNDEVFAACDRAIKEWIHSYNGYERIAGDTGQMAGLYRYVGEQFEKEGQIPGWVGVDLLRGWAFWQARCHNHAHMSDGYRGCCGRSIYSIAEAVRRHPAATPGETPPPIPNFLLKEAGLTGPTEQ
jgi:hypothetical protein